MSDEVNLSLPGDLVIELESDLTIEVADVGAAGAAGATDFLGLTDTPDVYTSQGGKIVAVKSDVSGLEFITPAISNLALGETETTAYRGDRGKTAYDHSQVTHAPSDAEKNVNADWNAVSGDAQILNKPTLGTAAAKDIPATGNASATQVVYGSDTRLHAAGSDNQTLAELGGVPETRTVNGLPLSADITINTQGGFASSYVFCDDVIHFTPEPTPVWHELERQSDGGTVGSHTATTTSYTELDRYVTAALNTTTIPEGPWAFNLYAKMSAQSGQIKAAVYRVDVAGAIVGIALGTAETAVFTNTAVVSIPCDVFIAAQTSWALTDRIGVIVSGKKVGAPAATLTWYHDKSSGWLSNFTTPITLLHNQMNGLNDGDYKHLTATQLAALHPLVTKSDTASVAITLSTQAISAAVIPGGVDHGSLAGLADDDHAQYLRTDGTRALTGNWDAGASQLKSSNVDINGGTIDGTSIGATSPAAGKFTNLEVNGTVTITGTGPSTVEMENLGLDENTTGTLNEYYFKDGVPLADSHLGSTSSRIIDSQIITKITTPLVDTNISADSLASGLYATANATGDNAANMEAQAYTNLITRLISNPTIVIGATDKENISFSTFQYRIDGVAYNKAGGEFDIPTVGTIPANMFGAIVFDIDVLGTITATNIINGGAGYSNHALCSAAVSALAVAASNVRMGYVILLNCPSVADFIIGTTHFDKADLQGVTFYSGDSFMPSQFPFGPVKYYYNSYLEANAVSCEIPRLPWPSGVQKTKDFIEIFNVPANVITGSGYNCWKANGYLNRWKYLPAATGFSASLAVDTMPAGKLAIIDGGSGNKILSIATTAAALDMSQLFIGSTTTMDAGGYGFNPANGSWNDFAVYKADHNLTVEFYAKFFNPSGASVNDVVNFGIYDWAASHINYIKLTLASTAGPTPLFILKTTKTDHAEYSPNYNLYSPVNYVNAFYHFKIFIENITGIVTLTIGGAVVTTRTVTALSAWSDNTVLYFQVRSFYGQSNERIDIDWFRYKWSPV